MPAIVDYEKGGTQKKFYEPDEVVVVPCPLCGEKEHRKVYSERGALGIAVCLSCGLMYTNPRLKSPEKIYWGNAETYFKEARLVFEGKAAHHRDPNYLEDLRLMRLFKPTGSFLDIGTNMGFFLRKARDFSWELYGVEPSPVLSEMARKHFGLNVKTAFLETANFESEFFDVVSLSDVFEHIPDPTVFLSEVSRVLKPDGVVFIKVPNGKFNLFKLRAARMLGRLAAYDLFDSYEHVIHYTQRTLCAMLHKSGFLVRHVSIGSPIQIPVWHSYVGHYYHYPSPWLLDYKRQSCRSLLYFLSLAEFRLRFNQIGSLAPNIRVIAQKVT
jgi:SAM-dependent methyltransferase